ncbi:MAG: BTAD domain-containing putative transcriptional regulator [Pseudomonadota bacterium]
MEFRILGPLEIVDGERRLALGGTKRRAVAALLLLEANRVVSSERLVDGVWGSDPPAAALASLQNHVLRLRRELGDRLVTRAPGYLLRVEEGELDLDRFRRLVGQARGREPDEAATLLREALALWRGPPLADLAAEPVAAASAHLDELRLDAVERRIDADLALGRHRELVPELESLAAEQPFRERLRGQLMLALYRSGRQADALAAYTAARTALVDELGTEPGPELQALHRAILRQDAELGPPAGPTAPTAPATVEETRKTVTVVAGELVAEPTPDPEARLERLRRAYAAAVAVLERHGGTAARTTDDRVLGVFGVPAAHDDDALRAVRAASELRAGSLVFRVGIATGDVITGDPDRGRPLASGPPLEEAERLRTAAAATEILVDERAWRLVRHAADAEERRGSHSLTRVRADVEPIARRLESPLVGREDELAELEAVFRRVVRDGRAGIVTVFGAAGVGKTRLAREAAARLAPSATCVAGRTRSSGDAPAYAPLRDALAPLAGGAVGAWAADILREEADAQVLAARIAGAMGEGPPAGPVEETAWAVRRLLERLARTRPLVVVLEDLHWAAPALLDVVEHVAELGRAPILLVALARPELLDARPDWGGGRLSWRSLLLEPLPAAEAAVLLDRLAVDVSLAPERRTSILTTAAGNPLFLEQLLAAALEGGGATIPDSIQALLAARLDRLDEMQRRVVQAAAVYGATFPAEVVGALVEADVPAILRTLARRDLVEPDPRRLGGDTWSFRHALVREQAYASIPKVRRARLHERVAALLGRDPGGDRVDANEAIGHHLEAAYRAAADVDPQAPELPRLAAEAASHLAAAGLRANEERDVATSAPLLGRAWELLPRDAPERRALATELADALAGIGDPEAALRVLDEAEQATPADDARTRARLLVFRHGLRLFALEPEDPAVVLADARRAIATFEAAGDDEGLASAHILAYQASSRSLLEGFDPEGELTRAVEHARAAGARRLEGLATSWLCIVLRHGTVPVPIAARRIEELLADPPTQFARASALGGLADLRAMAGRFDEARALVAENHALIEDLGLPQTTAADLIAVADVELLAGDLDAAERILRDALARLDALGDRYSAVNVAWRLALVLVRRGRDEEVEALLARAGDVDAGYFVDAWVRVLRATLAAQRGRAAEARRLLDEADRRLAPLPGSGMRVDLLLQAADVCERLGRVDDAAARLRDAASMAEGLGYTVALDESRARLAASGR